MPAITGDNLLILCLLSGPFFRKRGYGGNTSDFVFLSKGAWCKGANCVSYEIPVPLLMGKTPHNPVFSPKNKISFEDFPSYTKKKDLFSVQKTACGNFPLRYSNGDE